MTTYQDVTILKQDGYLGLVWLKGRCYYQILREDVKNGHAVNVIGRIDDLGQKYYVPKLAFKTRMISIGFVEAYRITEGDIFSLQVA